MRTLWGYFDWFLEHPPKFRKLPQSKKVYLKADGSYFKRWGCVLTYKVEDKVIFADFVERETYFNYCRNLGEISELGYIVVGITSDRHGSLISAVKSIFPEIPHQYCLVHIQRRCQSLLTKNPQTEAGQELLELVTCINEIHSHYEKNIWLKWFGRYEKSYEDFTKERTYGINEEGRKTWWYTHKNLRAAFRTLKLSLENMFLYLDNANLGKDTNGLEAEFTHLKHKLRTHRGLKRWKQASFVKWYFYLRKECKKI